MILREHKSVVCFECTAALKPQLCPQEHNTHLSSQGHSGCAHWLTTRPKFLKKFLQRCGLSLQTLWNSLCGWLYMEMHELYIALGFYYSGWALQCAAQQKAAGKSFFLFFFLALHDNIISQSISEQCSATPMLHNEPSGNILRRALSRSMGQEVDIHESKNTPGGNKSFALSFMAE